MSWITSHWKVLLATFIAFSVGAIAGASGASQQDQIDQKDAQIASLRGDLRDARTEVQNTQAALDEAESYRADALRYREHRKEIAQQAAAAREAARKRRAEARAAERERREAAARAALSTIEGDGTWHVGEDFAAGTYRAESAGEGCYWARLKTAHGSDSLDDIIENGIGGGSQTVQLNDGEWFEVNECGEWHRIG
jgi:hypothetical protein